MSQYSFIEPNAAFPLPPTFNFDEYIETEQELWALFPETDGRRVNFVQIGLTAMIYAEVADKGAELERDETYILMPCADYTMRPIRMRACRRLTLSEYRMGHLTAVKLVLNSDAHSMVGLDNLGLAVATARKGGATVASIVNTRPLSELERR